MSDPDVITRLASAGLSADIIAYATETTPGQVRTIIAAHTRQNTPVLDEKMANEVRSLAAAAVRHAHLILEFGPSEHRLAIIKSMLSGLNRHIAQPGNEQEEARSALEALFSDIRDVPQLETVVTDEKIVEVASTESSAQTTDD